MTESVSSNTAESTKKQPRGKPFATGDKRINRKGRPKNFDALRTLAQQIAHEPLSGSNITRIEAILRTWSSSPEPQLQRAFVEIAYGKVKDEIQHSGAIRYEMEYVNDWRDEANQTADAAFRAKDDIAEPSALQVGERGATLAQDHDGAAPLD